MKNLNWTKLEVGKGDEYGGRGIDSEEGENDNGGPGDGGKCDEKEGEGPEATASLFWSNHSSVSRPEIHSCLR